MDKAKLHMLTDVCTTRNTGDQAMAGQVSHATTGSWGEAVRVTSKAVTDTEGPEQYRDDSSLRKVWRAQRGGDRLGTERQQEEPVQLLEQEGCSRCLEKLNLSGLKWGGEVLRGARQAADLTDMQVRPASQRSHSACSRHSRHQRGTSEWSARCGKAKAML